MANKRTKKYQTLPIQQYQFGGLNLPFLDQYQNLNKQWGNFWQGGNYFSPGNVPPTGVYADPKAMLYNTIGNNNAAVSAYTQNQKILKDNPYTGEWGDDAHNYYYNKTLGNTYTPDELAAFSEYEKKSNWNDFWTKDPDKYNAWYEGRENYAKTAGNLYDAEQAKRKVALSQQPEVNKNINSAFTNTTAGIFSGLNYLNSYKPPEDISLMQGNKGVMYSKKGGNVNLTGYTPGTSTNNNKSNTIPSGQISMEKTPFDIIAIGKGKGADKGLIKNLKANTPGYNFKTNSVFEIPIDRQQAKEASQKAEMQEMQKQIQQQEQSQEMIPTAQYGFNNPFYLNPLQSMQFGGIAMGANSLYNGQNQQAAYLNELPGGDPNSPYSYINATPEFNARMAASMPQNYGQKAAPVVPTQTGQFVPSSGMFPQQAAYTQAFPGDDNNVGNKVFSIKGDKTYDYAQDANGNWFTKRKNSSSGWINMKDKLSPDKYKDAVNKIQKGNIKPATTPTGKIKTASSIIKAAGNTLTGSSRAGINPAYLPASGSATVVSPNQNISNIGPSINLNDLYNSYPTTGSQPMLPVNNEQQSSYQLQVTDNNPTNNSNYAAPISYFNQKGAAYTQVPDAIALSNANTMNFSALPIGYGAGIVGKGIVNLPKIGKVIQYGGKYIDKAGNYISKTGNKLGKAPKSVLDAVMKQVNRNLPNVKTYPPSWEDIITKGLETPRFANPANIAPSVRNAWAPVPKQYGGYIPSFQFGGSVNDEHSTPIFSSNLEDFGLTELQTEKGEIAFMPDGSIVDVKAKESHKKQDKHNVSDIMQSGTYVFSDDPKMKFSIKSKLGGVELGEMNLGKSVFKYKENEITPGPEKIMLKDMFFNGSKKELTTAEIAKNIKKNIPIVDLKNDYFADRAIAENKDQRVEYLSILKAFNEYKKPVEKSIPKAQYGMPIQPTQNGLDGVMGYGKNIMDPFKKMDNNIVSMFNFNQPSIPEIPRPYNYGGDIPQAQFGWLADGIDYIGGWSRRAERDQRGKNRILASEAQAYRDDLQDSVDRSGTIGIGTNLATYAASLNVPLQKYDDQSEQMAIFNAAANQAKQRLEATKYTSSQGIGSASSLARYNNPVTYGNFLAQTQSQNDSTVGKINQAIADLDMSRANANVGFISARNSGRNNSLNARDAQLYNANVAGIGNVGKSMQESVYNSGDTRYRLGMEKMAYDAYLEDKAKAAKQNKQQQIRGYANELGSLASSIYTGGLAIPGLTPDSNMPKTGANNTGINWQNPNQAWQQSPASQQFNPNYIDNSGYNWSSVLGGSVNRPPYINPLLSTLTSSGYNIFGGG